MNALGCVRRKCLRRKWCFSHNKITFNNMLSVAKWTLNLFPITNYFCHQRNNNKK